jgi:hypothetical protein
MYKKIGVTFLISIFSILIGSGLLLSGCSDKFDTGSKIQEPKAENEEEESIDQVLKELLPSGAKFLTAKNADQKESIRMEDVNKDGAEYAFILYQDSKENQQAHLLVLQKEQEGYRKVEDLSTGFSNFDYFNLLDLDANGTKEVIIGGQISDSQAQKQLFIYEIGENGLTEKIDRSYEMLQIACYDSDDTLSLLILDGELNVKQTAELFQYQEGQLHLLSTLELNPEATHENVIFGELEDKGKALFIDSGLGAHSMLTEIVAFDQGQLKKIGEDFDGVLMKAYPLYSRDINGDGIIEVGGMYIPKGYEEAALAEIPFLYTYNDYKLDGSKETIEERYTDEGQHFYITIPTDLYGKVTIVKGENEVQLVSTEDESILFTVKWTGKNGQNINGTTLGETKDTIYYSESKEMTIPSENFHLMETELD